MGSEGPSAITVHVTGFKKFHGVAENPTETIVSNLKGYMQKKGLPKGLVLGNCNVLETAGYGALAPLYQILESGVAGLDSKSSNAGHIIWLHFGVNSGATRFAIEHQAVNEATFRCPDELGWKPQKLPIIPSDGGISRTRETLLPVNEITKALAGMGYDVMTSDDAGRFVCNYVYYHSLRFAEQHGNKSLFVHVPLFLTIDEETQMQFVASLLEIKCKCTGGRSDAHAIALALFNSLSSFSWDAKLVLALAAFAVSYGEFWLTAQQFSLNPLAKSVALLKQLLPDILEQTDSLKPHFDAINVLLKEMLDVANCIIDLKELPTDYRTSDAPAMIMATSHIPTAAYWTVRGIIACISQIIGLIGLGHEQLSSLSHKLSNISGHLRKQLGFCYQHIGGEERWMIHEWSGRLQKREWTGTNGASKFQG